MYYLYRHIRTDKNQPFYIGIGKKHRNQNDFRRAFSCNPRSIFWKSIKKRTTIKVEILFEHDDRIIIQQKEKEFISFYGRIDKKTGCLVNHTDGGEDHLGFSEEYIDKLRSRMLGNKIMNGRSISDEQKEKQRLNILGKKHTPETLAKLSGQHKGNSFGKANLGKKHSEETKKYLSSIRKLKITHQSKKVICIENNIIYDTITLCALHVFGENNNKFRMGITRACKPSSNNKYKNFHFKFL